MKTDLDPEPQTAQLERVSSAIGRLVLKFLASRAEFHANDLRAFVADKYPAAPGSADRILRDLRQRGQCDYRVKNRRKSLYEVLFVQKGGAE